MDIRKIRKLIELLEESGVSEIEIHEGEESVRISRDSDTKPSQKTTDLPITTGTSDPPAAPTATVAGAEPALKHKGHLIKSPMVGVFYTSPAVETLNRP